MKSRAIIALMLVLVLALAACSGNSGNTGNVGSASSGGETAAEKIEITFQHIGGTVPAQVELLEQMAKDFNAKYPEISVKVVHVGWGEAYSVFQRQVVVGDAPDLVMLTAQWASEYQTLGAFAPINDLVSQETLDIFLENGFVMGDDGKVYGLPWDGSIWSFFYRTDLFEEAGLDPNQPPKTWDELLQYARTLAKEDRYGFAFPASGWEPDDYFLPFMWQAGNDVVETVGDGWKSVINNEAGLAAAKFVYDLTNTHQVTPKTITGMDWEAVMNSFINGNTAMMLNGMWVANSLLANADLEGKWATAQSPAGVRQAVLGYPNTLHVTQQSEHKEAVGKLLEFIFLGDGDAPTYYEQYCEVTGVVGWTKAFPESEFAKNPVFAPFVDQVPYSRNRPIVPKYEEFRQLHFNPGIQSLILGDLTPEQFVKTMDEKLNELLAQ